MAEIQAFYFSMYAYNEYLVKRWLIRYKINYIDMYKTKGNEIKVIINKKDEYTKFKYRYITEYIRLRMGF